MLVWMDGKGPGELADFDIDWTARLNGDTILTSTWAIVGTDGPVESPPLLAIAATPPSSHTPALTKVWLTGGTLGITYILQNSVTTVGLEAPLTEMVALPMRNR